MARQTIQNSSASLYLNGTTGYMTSPVVPSPTGFSYAVWVRVMTAVINSRIMDYSDSGPSGGMNIAINSAVSSAWVIYNAGTIQSSLSAHNITGRWVHLAGTYIADEAKLYINGELVSTDTNVTMTAPTQTLTFGRRSAASTNFAQVFLSNIVLHNTTTPWTAQQVRDLYNKGTVPTGATAVYPLSEGAGTVAYDTSGNGNNGTITSGTWTRDTPTKTRKLVNNNLVYNGDFEIAPPTATNVATTTSNKFVDGTAGGSATNIFGWAFNNTNSTGTGSVMIDPTVSHSGGASLKVSTTATASRTYASVVPTVTQASVLLYGIPVLPSTSYTGSVWVKTNLVSGSAASGAIVEFATRTGVGGSVSANVAVTGIVTTTDWTQYTVTFTTGATARFITPVAQVTGNDGTGTLIMDMWIDDIQLYPTTPVTRNVATGRSIATGRSAA